MKEWQDEAGWGGEGVGGAVYKDRSAARRLLSRRADHTYITAWSRPEVFWGPFGCLCLRAKPSGHMMGRGEVA